MAGDTVCPCARTEGDQSREHMEEYTRKELAGCFLIQFALCPALDGHSASIDGGLQRLEKFGGCDYRATTSGIRAGTSV
jgi:hypothetical protein